MSIENGAGLRRSKRTRVPLAVAVNCSVPLPPLTSTVSVPSPPSLRSVSSPGFQIMRSLPAWPKAWSSASPPVSVSFSPPPNRRSAPPLPSSVSLPDSPNSWSLPEPPVRTSLPAPPNRFARGSAPLTSLSDDRVVAAEAEDLDQRRVGHRRRAADHGYGAAVDQDLARGVAADRDVVVEVVTGDAERAVGERRGHGGLGRAGDEEAGGEDAGGDESVSGEGHCSDKTPPGAPYSVRSGRARAAPTSRPRAPASRGHLPRGRPAAAPPPVRARAACAGARGSPPR